MFVADGEVPAETVAGGDQRLEVLDLDADADDVTVKTHRWLLGSTKQVRLCRDGGGRDK
jgi:hypothetical protein